jgi:hypothetical protein
LLFERHCLIMGSVTRLSILLCLSVAVFLAASVPILDEESYLAITQNFDVLRPYHWWRPWPPWYGGSESDAFVYAHPPLFLEWVAFWQSLAGGVVQTRLLAAVPVAALLGWSGGRLIDETCRRPKLGLACWVGAPIVVLGLQRGLMPDLLVTALCTTAVLGWRNQQTKWMAVIGGVALGLAAFTKYPALFLGPVLLLHGWRTGRLRASLPFWVAAAIPWLAGEAWLLAVYDRVHLLEVLTRASEISRGSGEGRALGMLVRLPLGVAILGLLARGHRWLWIPAFVVAGAINLWAWPDDLMDGQRVTLFGLAVVGALPLVVAGLNVVRGWRTPEVESDRLLLSLWALSVLAGVWGVHNFAAPRYMLSAMLPLALLLVLEIGDQPRARKLMWVGAGIHGLMALTLTVVEHRFFEAGADLARAAVVRFEPTAYTGEWSFRHEMDAAGTRFYTGNVQPGEIVVGPVNSSPGELPSGWVEVGRISADESIGIRVVDDSSHIGLYAETLGALPIGRTRSPIEEVIAWKVQ